MVTKKRKKTSNGKDSKRTSKKRGVKSDYTDYELKEIALRVKNEIKGQKLTFLELEKRTGIGRNTWSRRIRETIEELNNPPSRTLGISDKDEVYFPNIQLLFQVHGNNKNKIIHELHQFERDFYELYKQAKQYRDELEKLKEYKEKLEEKDKLIREFKEKAAHYEQLYKNITVSSAFSHLRDELSISHNLIDFNKNSKLNLNIDDLQSFFPDPIPENGIELRDETIKRKQDNLNMLKSLVPNVIK